MDEFTIDNITGAPNPNRVQVIDDGPPREAAVDHRTGAPIAGRVEVIDDSRHPAVIDHHTGRPLGREGA